MRHEKKTPFSEFFTGAKLQLLLQVLTVAGLVFSAFIAYKLAPLWEAVNKTQFRIDAIETDLSKHFESAISKDEYYAKFDEVFRRLERIERRLDR